MPKLVKYFHKTPKLQYLDSGQSGAEDSILSGEILENASLLLNQNWLQLMVKLKMITCLTQEHTNWEALHWEKWFETLVSAYPGLILFLLTELQTDQCFTKIITYHKGPCRIKNLITFMVKQNKFSTTRGTPYIHGTNLWLKKKLRKIRQFTFKWEIIIV